MNEIVLTIAIPAVLLAILTEYLLSKKKQLRVYTFNSTISNLSIGVAERISSLALTGIFYAVFTYIHDHFALFDIKESLTTWILLLFLTDFIWYWYCRLPLIPGHSKIEFLIQFFA